MAEQIIERPSVTQGNIASIKATLTRDNEAFPVADAEDIAIALVSGLGRKTVIAPEDYEISMVEEGVIYVDGPTTLSPGCYGLEVRGTLNGTPWRTYTPSALVVTYPTVAGGGTATATGDRIDITMNVQMYAMSMRTMEGIQQAIDECEVAADNANDAAQAANTAAQAADAAKEAVEETEHQVATAEAARVLAEQGRVNAEVGRVQAEESRVGAEQGRVTAELARVQAEQGRVQAEQARIAAEEQRIANEQARISAEETRQANEQQRISQEEARVREFARLKTESEAATDAATSAANAANTSAQNADDKAALAQSAATLANDKAQLAEDKAALAQSAATLANQKAQLADDKAALAQQKADYAQTQGNYAQTQGNYALAQGDYAKDQGDYAKEQGETVEPDHQRAESDHTRAESDHTRAESDHTASETAATAANQAATGAENVDVQLSGSVVTVTNRQGQSSSIDLLATTEELVLLTVTTDVEGVVVAGLPINVYYNGGSTPARTVELNAQGAAEIRVPINYEYRLVFPTVAGCKNIPDVVHTAVLAQRHIEVEYVAESSNTEHVMVTLKQRTVAEDVVMGSGYDVYVTTNGVTSTYSTNSSGVVEFYIPMGQTYEVSVPAREGWVTPSPVTLTASKSARGISMVYRYVSSGVAVVDNTSQEYSLDDFLAAVQGGTKALSDAVAIRVSTDALVQNNGVILLSIDGLAKNQYSTGYQWCNQNVLFSSIPENGNSPTATYYYDGKSASEAIQTEGDERSLQTPAVDFALGQTLSVGGVVHQGYLPSIGQWNVAWSNRAVIDDILAAVRPSDSGRLSSFTAAKWSSSQSNANRAWYWASTANDSYLNKNNSIAVVPFFAY